MGIKTTQNLRWFWNCWEKCEKVANKEVIGKKSMKNWSLSSSVPWTCKGFWQITFSGCIFFSIISTDVKSAWNSAHFGYTYAKKEVKKLWSLSTYTVWVLFGTNKMRIRKKWRMQLKNLFNKHFWEYYLASFCWWIPSSCENHCNLVHKLQSFQPKRTPKKVGKEQLCFGGWLICRIFEEYQQPAIQTKIVSCPQNWEHGLRKANRYPNLKRGFSAVFMKINMDEITNHVPWSRSWWVFLNEAAQNFKIWLKFQSQNLEIKDLQRLMS